MNRTNSLQQHHQLGLVLNRLGRIGESALARDAERAASSDRAMPRLSASASPAGRLAFPFGAQTRKVDSQGRLKIQLESMSLSDQLGWRPGALDAVIVDGWLVLSQDERSVDRPASRNRVAKFAATANGIERISLIPAHLHQLGLGADRHLLVAAVPDDGTLVIVNPAVCAAGAPSHVRRHLVTAS